MHRRFRREGSHRILEAAFWLALISCQQACFRGALGLLLAWFLINIKRLSRAFDTICALAVFLTTLLAPLYTILRYRTLSLVAFTGAYDMTTVSAKKASIPLC